MYGANAGTTTMELQFGRDCEVAEIIPTRPASLFVAGFNSAATVRSRKSFNSVPFGIAL